MKNMFYNYDHCIKNNDHITPTNAASDKMISDTTASYLINATGKNIGIRAKINNGFYVYFHFSGTGPDEYACNLNTFLEDNQIFLDILDFKREILCTIPAKLNDNCDEASVYIVTDEQGPLKYGVYKLHLYLKYNDEIYTLFSEDNCMLSVE